MGRLVQFPFTVERGNHVHQWTPQNGRQAGLPLDTVRAMRARHLSAPVRRLIMLLGGLAALPIVALPVASAIQSRTSGTTARTHHPRPLRTPLYGLTVDDIGNLPQIVDAVRRLPRRPTTRIVFDANQPASYYAPAVTAMQPVSYLMGLLLDSSDEKHIDTATYSARVKSYLARLGGKVDLWEIGNEVNGNWLGPYQDVEAKLVAAYNEVSAARKRTALTLYYNLGCGDGPDELDPITFSRQYVPARIRNGLNYVLLSYYEQNCGGIRPSPSAWQSYFSRLHGLYPHAQLGFGEIGLTNPANDSNMAYAAGMIRYYYSLPVHLPYYAGGYFWWYCGEDCVPFNTKPLFGALRGGFGAEAAALRRHR
jgi:hypothetical protein